MTVFSVRGPTEGSTVITSLRVVNRKISALYEYGTTYSTCRLLVPGILVRSTSTGTKLYVHSIQYEYYCSIYEYRYIYTGYVQYL